MPKQKSHISSIREIETIVNRLMEKHKSSYEEWLRERLENPHGDTSRSIRDDYRKKGKEKAAHA